MGLIPRLAGPSLKDWFRGFFHGGMKAVAAEEAANLQLDALDAQSKVIKRAAEIRQEAKGLYAAGDEFDRYLAQATDASLRDTVELGRAMLNPMTAEERAEVLSRPLPASTESQASLPPADTPAALAAPPVPRGLPKGTEAKSLPGKPSPNGHANAAPEASADGNGSQPHSPQPGAMPQAKRGRGRPRKYPHPGDIQG